jgi:iron-sulfur cluster repair protein YtfE (RIC family)
MLVLLLWLNNRLNSFAELIMSWPRSMAQWKAYESNIACGNGGGPNTLDKAAAEDELKQQMQI